MMIETYADLLSPSEKGKDEFGWRCANFGDYFDRQSSRIAPMSATVNRVIGLDTH